MSRFIDDNIDKKKNKKKSKSIYFCGNCGKSGHNYRNCHEPITSYGVIMILLTTSDNNIITNIIDKFTTVEKIESKIAVDSDGIVCCKQSDIQTFCEFKNNIKFLMIRRKHTLGYIEFVRGRYNVENLDGIIFLFKQMTPEEIKRIGSYTFDELWDEMWAKNKNKNNYHNEYVQSKQKFERLKNENEGYLNLDFYVNNVQPSWNNPEWGFPKGRRNHHEDDLECGLREFREESGFANDDYILLDKIEPLEESFIGTNGINYRHVYYLAIATSDKEPIIDNNNKHQVNEVGDIGWFTFDEAINMIRPYHTERKKLLTELYMYTINSINDIHHKVV